MKKILLTLALLTSIFKLVGQPAITNVTHPNSVNLFDLFEVSFEMGPYNNPYDPDTIAVYAIFTSPNNTTIEVPAFYYEGYTFQEIDGHEVASPGNNGWRIRFTPTCTGDWSFRIVAEDSGGIMQLPSYNSRPYSFTCTSVNNANGFISKANSRYLKQRVVINGAVCDKSFFPIGPNIAWYSCNPGNYGIWTEPHGIYDYERYVDSLAGNGNYMRIWLNRYQYLNLYGPEYTQNSTVYFDSTLNQKDAAELDHIVTYAAQHGVTLMMCIYSYGDFRFTNSHETEDPTVWSNNPYNTLLHISTPCDVFTEDEAIRVSKNLIRYIVSRWGYATNIMCWELWNEVSHMYNECPQFDTETSDWHDEMADFIRDIDPFHHCISTSMGGIYTHDNPPLYMKLFDQMDIVQQHNYQEIQSAKSKKQLSYILYQKGLSSFDDYPTKPFFMGEFAFDQNDSVPTYQEKDPKGIDLHNSLWSSLFSGSMGPGSFWYWHYIDNQGLFNRFNPILTFCNTLPILSSSFRPYTTGKVNSNNRTLDFPNGLETYYLKNAAEDTIYGWSQDTAFCYQSLRWVTDSVRIQEDATGHAWHFVDGAVFDPLGYVYTLNPNKKPGPCFNSNTISIPLINVCAGTQYRVSWYNSETGLVYSNPSPNVAVYQKADGTRWIDIEFPSFIRDLQSHTISNTFGDAVFKLTRKGLDL